MRLTTLIMAAPVEALAPGSARIGEQGGWSVWWFFLIPLAGMVGWWLARNRLDRPPSSRANTANGISSLLERTDCLLWEADVTLAGADWKWKFKLEPSGLSRRLLGGREAARDSCLWDEFEMPDKAEMDRCGQTALRDGRLGYAQRFRVIASGKVVWLNESVSIIRKSEGNFHLVGLTTDITAQQEAELARRASEEQLTQLMTRADCLLWQADLTQDLAGALHWEWFVPSSELYRRIVRTEPKQNAIMPWGHSDVPEFAEMEARSRHAIGGNLPGYEQIFSINLGAEVLWLHEQVSITPLEDRHWKLAGVVIDITAQQDSEQRLAHLLERTDCTIWHGRVSKRTDGELDWNLFIPPSKLCRRIFGGDPRDMQGFSWGPLGVPEYEQMRVTSKAAVFGGAAGYEQIFHLPRPESDLWLSEQVSITPSGADGWNLIGIITDVSAHHKAEEARRSSEAQLRQILELADCVVWHANVVRDPADSFTWMLNTHRSVLYRRLFGDDNTETVLEWRKLNVPEIAEMGRRAQEAMGSGASGYEQEFRVVQPDRTIWLHEVVTIMRLAAGQLRLVGVITDISARREAELAVHASEVRYRSLFQHTPVAVVETDFSQVGCWLDELRRSGVRELAAWLDADERRLYHGAKLVRVSDTNEAARQMLRARRPSDFWRRRGLLATSDSLAAIRSTLVALWEGRNSIETQVQMRDFEGAMHHMNFRWWIAQSETGLDLRQSALVLVDLTELKRTETALADEKERLAVTLRAMAEGVITTDVVGRVQFINPAASAVTQWEADAIGLPLGDVCVLENDRTGAAFAMPVTGDAVAELPAQSRLVTRTGQRRLVDGCCAPIQSAAGRVIGMVFVFRDVTAHERLQQELVRATRLESVGILAGGIAHDFNNILTGVLGNIALAQLDVEATSDAGARLREAEKATLRARDLTQQLLTFAKGGEPVRTAVQLEAILRETTTFALHGSNVRAVYHLAPDLWSADADQGQIGRVVQNLVINAVQAMPAGGALRVTAHNDVVAGHPGLAPGNYVQIVIADTGEGIRRDDLTRIFDPYFTTKQSGSGLGLAAVYSIIKKHGGHIGVESEVGRGTSFQIWLPAMQVQPASASFPLSAAPQPFGGRVLFMDDEEVIRRMAALMLQRLGFEVECATDGVDAVEKFRAARAGRNPFALVIMDLTVPGGMGGRDTITQLRAIDPQVKAIVSSGYSSDPVLSDYRTHGFCGVVVKPYQRADLVRALQEALATGPSAS